MEQPNRIAKMLFVVGVLVIICGLIVGITVGSELHSFRAFIYFLIISFIIGLFIIGFSEIIRLLESISSKMKVTESITKDAYFNSSRIVQDNNNATHLEKSQFKYDLSDGKVISISGKVKGNQGSLNVFNEILVNITISSEYVKVDDITAMIVTIPVNKIMTCYWITDNKFEMIYLNASNSDQKLEITLNSKSSKEIVDIINEIRKK